MLLFLSFVFIFVFIIGVSEILHNTKLRLFKTKDVNNTLICYLSNNSAELNLRYVIEQFKWHGKSFASRIIAINNIDSTEVLNECIKLARNYNIDILTPEEFCRMLKNGEIGRAHV